jgi:hypothetical protein
MTDYMTALRAELLAATGRPPRRRRAVAGLGMLAVLVLAALAATTVDPSPASADVVVRHRHGRVIVRLTDRQTTAREIEAATDKAGLDIRVEAVPAGPSIVGRFTGQVASAGAVELTWLEEEAVSYAAFSLPERWRGRLTLLLGRRARPGEPYVPISDAYAEGEPLACSGTLRRPLAEVLPYVRGLDDVRVQPHEGGLPTGENLSVDAALQRGLGAAPITRALAVSATSLVIEVDGPPSQDGEPPC